MIENLFDALIHLPDLDEWFEGKLELANENSLLYFNNYPHGFGNHRSISVAFIILRKTGILYTTVQCQFHSFDTYCICYSIEELYKGGHLNKNDKHLFTQLQVGCTWLTSWINQKQFSFGREENKVLFEAESEAVFDHKLSDDVSICLRAFLTAAHSRGQSSFTQKSGLVFKSEKGLSRSDFLSLYLSFLNFLVLCLPKIPETTKLQLSSELATVDLVSLPVIEEVIKPNDVVVRYAELANFQIMVAKYFEKRNQYDEVVELWQACMKNWDVEIKFLHLTQALETFHRDVLEFSGRPDADVVSRAEALFGKIGNKKRWIQLVRYFHLYERTIEENTFVGFPSDFTLFLSQLTDSRNFYTHHGDKNKSWNRFELFEANRILRRWIRFLLLEHLGLQASLNSIVAGRETFIQEDLNVFENPYSMRYKHYRY